MSVDKTVVPFDNDIKLIFKSLINNQLKHFFKRNL